MDNATKSRYKNMLTARLQALQREATTNAEARNTVMLDQSSVGRLSRMDALQQQAMAKATQARRGVETRQITAALQRLEDDDFGYCENCGQPIPEARLALSPTVIKCVGCV